jgi:magnesium chelatase family protein
MMATAQSFTLDGITARPVRVEVDVHRGLPAFSVVGLPDSAVRETRERVRAALINCGFEFPLRRIVANLAPASLRKAGPGLDLAVAVALLAASGQIDATRLSTFALVGELALDGSVRPVPGALAIAEAAQERGVGTVVVPVENGPEAALAGEINVVALESLAQVAGLATGEWDPERPRPTELSLTAREGGPDLADIRGQHRIRHALEVAAAGGHNLLMVGRPGAGKSLAAVRLPSIMPPLTRAQAIEVARIAGACGRSDAIAGPPFRAPHHTISPAGLIGGGALHLPGEVTLAHGGVLFLDELCEFRRDTLEALTAPLQTGSVAIARAGSWRRLPSRFILLAAANPCPCGIGGSDAECNCAPLAVRRYQARLDRCATQFDIRAEIQLPSTADIAGPPGESSATVRERVCAARERQEHRLGSGRNNAAMTPSEVRECGLSEAAAGTLACAYTRRRLTGSTHERVIRLARTLADLTASQEIGRDHIAHALQLRGKENR